MVRSPRPLLNTLTARLRPSRPPTWRPTGVRFHKHRALPVIRATRRSIAHKHPSRGVYSFAADRYPPGNTLPEAPRLDARPTADRAFFDRPYLLLSLTSLFWSINLVLGRFIAGTVPPAALAQVRWAGAALILLPFGWRYVRRDWPEIRTHLPILIILSLTGITLYNTVAYYGLNFTEAINALLIQSVGPLVVGLWSLILFRDRLTRSQFAGILVSLLGVLAILTRGHPKALMELTLNHGDIWIIGGVIIYALYTVLLKKRPQVHSMSFLTVTVTAGAIMIIPLTALEYAAGDRIDLTPEALAVMAYVVVFPSLIAYFFFNRGVELIGANRAGQFFHLIPVFGSILAILFLGERPQWYHGVGYALILTGIVVAQRRWRPAAN
ncbi:MAG: DMT family transporter [Hyphomicrobiales bacterium]|nr:DMT family transporter [Hyphomicrobiales bacterium]